MGRGTSRPRRSISGNSTLPSSIPDRLREDFELSVILLLCVCAILGISPFAVFRLISGDLEQGVLDLLIEAGVVAAGVHAWRTGETRRTGILLALVVCAGGTVVATRLGTIGLFWLFPAFLATFFLVSPRLALALTGISIAIASTLAPALAGLEERLAFVTSGLVLAACALVLSVRHDAQRRRLGSLARHDPLTGTKNRRAMMEEVPAAVETALRSGQPQALVLLDLDEFKRINDQHGHAAGDRVLARCGELLRKRTRTTDRVFRFGGEEFALLLPGMQPRGLAPFAEELRRAVVEELESPAGRVTASFGAASLTEGESWESWVGRADRALYRAKAAGRNRVEVDALPDGTGGSLDPGGDDLLGSGERFRRAAPGGLSERAEP